MGLEQCKNIPEDKIIDFNIPDPGSNLIIKNAVNMNTATSETILDVTLIQKNWRQC